MHKTEILSTLEDSPESLLETTPQAASQRAVLIFDACHLGVVLRAVLGVQALLALAAMYSSPTFSAWLLNTAWLTSGGLPGTLLWLLIACTCKRLLHRLASPVQYGLGIALGAVAGLYATAMLSLTNELAHTHWWANAMAGTAMAAVLVGYLVLRARGRTPAATAAQLALLQARIRPHFLFNALNSAVALVRDEPKKAERLLENLSDLFRAALQDPRSTITLREEIDLAQRYLDIEQIRFGDRLQVQWDIDPLSLDVCLPPLLLQPLVENAVKHGVEPSEIGTKVTISTQKNQKNFVLLVVTNTLNLAKGWDASNLPTRGYGMALSNVEHRLRLLHDVEATFSAGPRDGVFEVRISLPSS